MLRKIIKHIAVFILTMLALWMLLIFTSLIPNDAIKDNLSESAVMYNGIDPFYQDKGRNTIADNYADVILLNVLWNINSDDPLVSSLDTKYFDGNDGENDYGENYGLYAALRGAEPNTDYSRYWHGSVVSIRPLLLLFNVQQIKSIGFVSALVLLILNCILLIKRRQKFAAAALILSFAAVSMQNIRLALEYQPVVLVCLVMLPFYIILENKGDSIITTLSVISGVMTAFFDFLTSETLAVLIPLAVVMIIRKQDDRFNDFKQEIFTVIKSGSVWILSYAFTFLTKWLAASIVTGENKFLSAISSASVRFSGETEDVSALARIFIAPLVNFSTMFGGYERISAANIIFGIMLVAVVFGGGFMIFRSPLNGKGFVYVMLVIGIIPYFRYIVLNNHSYLHDFFTYRAQASTVLAFIAVLWFYTFGAKSEKAVTNKRKKRG